MHRKSPFIPAILILLLAGTASFGQSLSDIQRTIKEKKHKWIAGETSVSRLSDHEKKRRTGLLKQSSAKQEPMLAMEEPATGLAASVDWSNYVTDVRNQGSCGSCWAFAATAALEANLLIRGNVPGGIEDKAEQILVSCSGAGSCDGGYIGSASSYIQSTGLPDESLFAYSATDNVCSNAYPGWQNDTSKIGSWSYITASSPDITAIKTALASYGPLVTTMDVYNDFFSYKGGIYQYSTGSLAGGHAVLIVGYTDDSSVSGGGYFKVKNSWGTGWGLAGYFLIAYSQIGSPVYFGEYTIAYSEPIIQTPPAAPTGLAVAAASSSQLNLSWTDNAANEDGFKIERCAGSNCTNFVQVASVGANVRTYSNSSLSSAETYTYRVRAYNTGGNSDYSNTAAATTLCSCTISPKSKSFTAAGGSSAISVTTGCSWTAKSNAAWITFASATAGIGNGTLKYTVARNTGARRTGTITINGNIFTITQAKK